MITTLGDDIPRDIRRAVEGSLGGLAAAAPIPGLCVPRIRSAALTSRVARPALGP
jgi:hypothetical protein